jgi:hypothetical protein
VLGFGFTGVSLAEALQVRTLFHLQDAEEVRRELLRGRRRFLQKLQGANRDLVEFFDPQRFSDTSSLLENLLFSSPICPGKYVTIIGGEVVWSHGGE